MPLWSLTVTLLIGAVRRTELAVVVAEPVVGMLAMFWLDQYWATLLSTVPLKAEAVKAGAPERTV